MEKLKMHTPDLAEENYRKLAALFPDAVTETIDDKGNVVRAIDKDVLMQEINAQVVDDGQERYQFTWPDKRKSVVLANAPIAKTLRFEQEKSVGRDGTPGGTDSENIYIEGDNLDALKLLQETYLGKVKMIYIDPPYNTGNDFIYEDDFSISAKDWPNVSGEFDEDMNHLVQNNNSNGRFHTDWLNMLYPRLKIGKDFLSADGIAFISIGEEELTNLMKMCDDIFGEVNRIAIVSRVSKTASNMGNFFSPSLDYILCYAKDINQAKKFKGDVDDSLYKKVEVEGARKGERYRDDVAFFQAGLKHGGSRYPITCPDGEVVNTPDNKPWRANQTTFEKWNSDGIIVYKKTDRSPLIDESTGDQAHWNLYTKSYLKDRQETGTQPRNILTDFINRRGADLIKTFGIPFDFAKPVELIEFLAKVINAPDAVIMDFFSGSATTAHSVMKLNSEDNGNRKVILVQLPEKTDIKSEAFKSGYKTVCDIGEERIRRAGKKIKEETGADIDYGFRCFKVDSSNMKDIYYRPTDIGQMNLDQLTDNIKEDRTPEDLLIQVMLDLGVLLSSKVEKTEIAGKKVFSVADGYLIACFDQAVTDEVVTAIAKRHPFYAVFRDSSMASDSVAANFEQIFDTYSPQTVRKVL